MNLLPDLPLTIRVGGPLDALERRPLRPYAEPVLSFLSALSKALLGRAEVRDHPDIAAFAFWCRPANLSRLSAELDRRHARIGRGLVLHVAPSNVPVNFAYSFAFGLLAGNANIVRIPDGFAQVEIICDAIAALFAMPDHARVAAMNRLVRYPRDDAITTALSAECQARMIWGGDATVAHLKQLPAPPRCVDVAFADRYSLCLLGAEAVLAASEEALADLARGFFNDSYLFDQNGCSSPHLVLWQGSAEASAAAQRRFWPALEPLVRDRYPLTDARAVDKFAHLCRTAGTVEAVRGAVRHDNLIYRIALDAMPVDIERHRGQSGTFFEHVADGLEGLAHIVTERYQTVTCFGLDRQAVVDFVVERGLLGIDRVVPVGKALDMGVVWDGYMLVEELSRIVHSG
ncbi:acyl-CoA reductase [Novosphingobium sp. PS1R-30]|uniref:Acyl-CoA reductase n=1 Tax=Novosphingobium anseongense TaxID=3133436 RepID=A0ABU8RVD1_9SPHN